MANLIRCEPDETRVIVQMEFASNAWLPLEIIIPFKSLWWIARKARLDFNQLRKALEIIHEPPNFVFGVPYREIIKKKASGGVRYIHEPCEPLKLVQQGINRFILGELTEIAKSPNAFGFSGGCAKDALLPHLKSKSMLLLDIQEAFSSTEEWDVYKTLNNFGYSKGVARLISIIATYKILVKDSRNASGEMVLRNALPQGAPTSPRLFDLAMRAIDEKIRRLARNTGVIVYTRYADNLIISTEKKHFPPKIRRAVIRIIKKHGYVPHKIREEKLGENSVRLLGYNIIDRQIYNTREFKRNLRLVLHHCEWLENHGQETASMRSVLNGYKGWVIKETLPQNLKEQLSKLDV